MASTIAKSGVTVVLFLVLCNALSCSTHQNLAIHQSDALSVMLREMPAGYPLLEPYHHSYAIDAKDISDILNSLSYESGSLLPLSGKQRHHVFTEHQATRLGPVLSNALRLALPQEVVAFSVADAEKSHRRTKGLLFVLGDDLHLIIEEMQKPVYQGETSTYQQEVLRWELHPSDKQRHYARRPEGKGSITNWIITPLR